MSLKKMKYEDLNLLQCDLMAAYNLEQQKIEEAQKNIESIRMRQRDLGAELLTRANELRKKKEIDAEKLKQEERKAAIRKEKAMARKQKN